MIRLSVVIITLNEEKNLERCLRSIKNICDEILVVDSYSTDETVKIAKAYGAKVIFHSFEGYTEQKNFATQQASHDWILSLDADEVLSPELENSITAIKENPESPAYSFNRLTNYCGKWIRHGGWYPDTKTRLYNREMGKWVGAQIHEKWEVHVKGGKVEKLKGDLLHYSYHSVSDHIKQIEKFTEIIARTAVANGKKSSLFKIWFNPKWKFFSSYILRLGFLDGFEGYLISKLSAMTNLIKYSKIRLYNAQKKY